MCIFLHTPDLVFAETPSGKKYSRVVKSIKYTRVITDLGADNKVQTGDRGNVIKIVLKLYCS